MKRFLFAAALVALVASVGSAEDKPATGTTPTTTAAPVVITTAGTPIVEYAPAQTTRRGLFGRIRNRNNNTMTYSSAPIMSAPIMSAPIMTAPTGAAPMLMPMPGTKVSTAPTGTIVQATGNLPPGTYTTTDGTIIQIGGTQTSGAVMTAGYTEPAPARRGLFSRLRNR